MNKKKIAAFTAALAVTIPLVSSCSSGSSGDSVDIMMDVGYLPKHAPFFAAVAQGFFDEEDLDVSLMPGSGSNNTVTSVETGRVFAGFADFGVTVMNQGRGAEVRQVNLLQARSAYAAVADKASGIESWEDLKGKTVATEGAGAMVSMWPYALNQLGYSESDINVVHASSESKIPGLLAHQWDANLALAVSDAPALAALGIEPVVLNWADIGISLYGNGMVVSNETIENEPEKLERFNRALQKGFLWACENPEQTYKDFNAEVQGYEESTILLALEEQCALNWQSETTTEPFGAMSDEGVQQMIDIAQEYLGMDPSVSITPDQVYTNDFITPITQGTVIAAPTQEK
ncbi:ABC transporter substrate-binding protein [Corynebacterium suranareeae]|uniref:ABC transporter substrate-binding protein n=1 Tax=Corynebacterium suranareeae TaxID=2506452 RepID=A0A160PNI8_9CORY|nr:ABC transporter substrate-binding protein [Corynebacterium suranareeae]BAU94845.1 ABC transporter substrate-binding protein [Corynebacterium suranareeae]